MKKSLLSFLLVLLLACCAAMGETIRFGTLDGEELVWLVLEKDEESCLLLSVNALYALPYHDSETAVSWKDCSLRARLNGEFFETAFSEDEKAKMLPVFPESDGTDRVSLPDADMVTRLVAPEDRICVPTRAAFDTGIWAAKNGGCWWWLRTETARGGLAPFVMNDGSVPDTGEPVTSGMNGVRPCIRVITQILQ